MAIVHKVKGEKKTFGEFASLILLKAVHEASNSTRLDIVFDVYNENSIKNAEQYLRQYLWQSASGSVEYKNIQSKQLVVQWRKFLTSTSNKTSLIQFEWKQQKIH